MTTRLSPDDRDEQEFGDDQLQLTDEQLEELIGDDDEEGEPLIEEGDGDDADDADDDGEPDSSDDEADDDEQPDDDEDEETPEEEDPREGTADTDDSPAEGEAANVEGADPPAAEGDAARSSPAAPEAFAFTADGQRVEVPDSAVVDIEGQRAVVISLDAWQRHVQPHLRHQSVWQRKEQELRARDPERHPDVIAARTMTAKLKEILEDETGEKLHEFVDDFRRNRELLERDVRIAQLEASRQAEEAEAAAQREAEEAQQLEAQMQHGLRATLERMAEEEFPGLPVDAAYSSLWAVRDRIFAKADRDYPEYGLREGEIAIHFDRIRQILEPIHKAIPQPAAAKEKQGKPSAARSVEERNRLRLARGKKPAPVGRAASGATPAGKRKAPRSREEWERDALRQLQEIANDPD